jgi:hypothetical protein
MTAAACVGRVGGLAVALGIGAAMATAVSGWHRPTAVAVPHPMLRAAAQARRHAIRPPRGPRANPKPRRLLAMSNGWAGTEHLTAQAELNKVPISAFEVVDVSGIRVDPATGWQISQ